MDDTGESEMVEAARGGAGKRRASIGARRNPETAAAVLAAARQLLIERGYAGFSLEAVARLAGAGKPTIYRWWPTKGDLFIAVYMAEKDAALALPDEGSLARDLALYTSALWRFWRGNPAGGAFRGLVAEAQGNAATLAALRDTFLPERMQGVRIMFERAVARGEFASEELPIRMGLWLGFNWLHLLTDALERDDAYLARSAAIIAGTPASG